MPSRKPYGCVFCPTYLLAFLVVFFFLAGAFFLAFARGLAFSLASAFGADGAGAAGASTPATRISTWLVRFRIGLPRPLAAAGDRFSRCRLGFALRRRALGAVAAEQPGRGEFSELVADHVLGDVDGDELVPVVHREGVADEVGRDRAAPRPGLEHLLLVPLVEGANLHHQRLLDVRTLLDAASHYCVAFPRFRPRTMSFVDRFFLCRVFLPSTLPHGLVGGRPPDDLPSPPPSG